MLWYSPKKTKEKKKERKFDDLGSLWVLII